MPYPRSKFKSFMIPLPGDAQLSGIACIPSVSTTTAAQPLLITAHGGLCHAQHFDVDENHTASLSAFELGIPVVSINRPCYKDTSSFLPLPEGISFQEETGRWEHERIFPALWQHFGVPNGCTAIVALGHSLAVPGLVVAAARYAQDAKASYPLAGLIFSGWGSRPIPHSERSPPPKDEPLGFKTMLMLSDPALRLVDDGMEQHIAAQTTDMPAEETSMVYDGRWAPQEREFAASVRVPVMFAVAEHDWLWTGTKEHVREYEGWFTACPRFDGSVLLNAPHAIEWSRQARGWYSRCFGFALEVTVHKAINDELNSSHC